MAVTAVKNPFETNPLLVKNAQGVVTQNPVTVPTANNPFATNTNYNPVASSTAPTQSNPAKSVWDTVGGGGGGSTNTYNNTITGFDTFQPDASAANPTTKQELRNWAGATDTSVRSTGGDTGFVNNYFNAWNADQATPASTTPQQTTTAPASTSAIPESQKPPATTVGANYNNNVSGFNIGVNNPNAISGFNNYTPNATPYGVDAYTSYIMGPNVDPATVWNEFSSKFNTKDPQSIKSGLAWIGQVGGPEKLNATMNYLKTISKAGDPNSPYNLANKDDLSKFTFDSPHYQAGLKFAQASLNKLGITDLQIKDSTSLADAYLKRVAQAGGKLDPNELKHWKSAAFLFGIDDSKLPPELQSSAFGMGTGAPDDPYTLAGQVFAASYGFPQVKDINTLAAEFDKRPKPLSQEEAQLWKEAAMMFGFDGSGFDFINGGKGGAAASASNPGVNWNGMINVGSAANPQWVNPVDLYNQLEIGRAHV